MKKTLGVGHFTVLLIVIAIAILIVTTGYSYVNKGKITFIDEVDNRDIEASLQSDELNLSNSSEYKSWKNTSDTTFKSLYNGNQAEDILAMRPAMVILWAGYGFSKSYYSPRGHMYAIDDLHHSLRTGSPRKANDGPQPASCWSCKSLDVPRLVDEIGLQGFYKKKWYDWGSEVVNPVGCADCHDPESMDLRVSRSFLTDALKRGNNPIENASNQKMRSLICAQCHAEYYLKGENQEVVLPWDNGYTVEEIENYYDQIGFTDFTHKLSRAPILKAQHLDYELAQMGIHARRGVSCGECHMPYMEEELRAYNNHHIQSPLAMVEKTCQSCHRQSADVLRQDVYTRQNKVMEIRTHLEKELVKAHIEAKFAWDRGATEKQMEPVLKLLRQAQWRWDFCIASHGAAFHAPQEVERILGDGLYKTMQARLEVKEVLNKHGYNDDVPLPDISTKEKAQKYIGLDIQSEMTAKEEFLKIVVPQWIEEAKANKRFIEEYKVAK
ncbi:MAG: ammonia-forming cytochrome c nitrite reductase [Parabacteroides gordonii]|nr:ammonia-forming cytochrome c nitrite reductase [Parabacteroides gordonii]